MHDEPISGHLAYLRTYLKVKNHYYWPTMRKDIKEYCTACEVCIANTNSTLRAFLFPHELAKFPFQVIGIDFLGPIQPVSPNGNNCICVITDYFTKYVIAVALPDQTARTTAECVYKHVVLTHGPPLAIVSDRGPNFTSGLFKYFCKQLNIEQRFTTAYNPASNGETERFNRTLTTMLRKELVDGQHHNWEDVLGEICFAYRASVHSSTNESPYYMMHGRDCNFPINKILGAVPEAVPSSGGYVDKLLERLRYSFHRAREENEKARERQRQQYNKRAKVFNYKPGDRVLLDVRVVQKGDNRKFTSKFRGPYRVVKVYPNRTVDIADNSYNCQLVHCNRLKPLYETMLWMDDPIPDIESSVETRDRFRKHIATQTNTEKQQESENDYEHDVTEQNNIMEDTEGESSESQSDATSTPPSVTLQTVDDMVPEHTCDTPTETCVSSKNLPRLRARSTIRPKTRLIAEI
jgi:hypothetical protein